MRPVFEDLPACDQVVEMRRLVTGIAVPQRMMMGALNDGDGVDLDVAKVLDCRQGRLRGPARSLGGWHTLRQQDQFSGFLNGK